MAALLRRGITPTAVGDGAKLLSQQPAPHSAVYRARGLYFQSFDRLYNAYQEFLQALFIARRTYPIAYNKWIREQIEEILGLPELYAQLSHLFEIKRFESAELAEKALEVERLLEEYAPAPGRRDSGRHIRRVVRLTHAVCRGKTVLWRETDG